MGDAAALFQAQEAAAVAAQGFGRSTRLSVRLPEPGRSRGRSGRGERRSLPQPCPRRPGVRFGSSQIEAALGGVRGKRGGEPRPWQCGHRNKEGSANFTPESRQLQRRKVRQLATLVGMGRGTRGCSRPRQAGKGPRRGGNPCFPGGVPGRCLGSPLPFLGVRSPVPSSCRPGGRVRCARRVPSALFSPPQPEREGSERTEGFVVHPGSEPDAATGPGCPPRPLDSLAWSMPEPPPTPPSPVPWTRGGCSSLPICIYISLSVCVCVSPQPLTFPFSVCSWEGWRGGGKSVGSTLCCRGAEGRPRFPASCSRLRKAEKHRKAGLG